MLPDVSDVLTEWEQSVILKTVTKTTVDFVETTVVTATPVLMVVQVAEKEKLNLDSLNWSKEYKWFHAKFKLELNQFVEHHGIDYKLVSQGDNYKDYGYTAFAGEETKKPLLVAT